MLQKIRRKVLKKHYLLKKFYLEERERRERGGEIQIGEFSKL